MSGNEFMCLGEGLCYASICTSLNDQDAEAAMNFERPTGIASSWTIADEAFPDGTPNPAPCPQHPDTHRHLLLVC